MQEAKNFLPLKLNFPFIYDALDGRDWEVYTFQIMSPSIFNVKTQKNSTKPFTLENCQFTLELFNFPSIGEYNSAHYEVEVELFLESILPLVI